MSAQLDIGAHVALLKVLKIFVLSRHHADSQDPSGEAAHGEGVEMDPVLEQALGRLDPKQPTVSLQSLTDCIVLGQTLKDLDPTFDLSQIKRSNGPSQWLTRRDSLLALYKGLFAYIRRRCRDMMPQASILDMRSIAMDPDFKGMTELLSLLIVAALMGEDNDKYVGLMSKLDPPTLSEIRTILEKKQHECARVADTASDTDSVADPSVDVPDVHLGHDVKHETILLELDTSRKQSSDLISRLERLQANYDGLLAQHSKLTDELEETRKAGRDDEFTSHLTKQRIREMEDLIASQESEISFLNDSLARLKGEVRDLVKKSQHAEELEDVISELRHANEELSKKANAAERYRQKLTGQQNLAAQHQTLNYEKTILQHDYDALAIKMKELEDSVEKYRTRDQTRNRAIQDAARVEAQLKVELMKKEDDLSRMQILRQNDDKIIADLQDQLKTGGILNPNIAGAPDFIHGGDDCGVHRGSLEAELIDGGFKVSEPIASRQPSVQVEISRLRAELDLAKSSVVSTDELIRVQSENDSLKVQIDELRRDRSECMETTAHQQTIIRDVLVRLTGEELVPIINQTFQKPAFKVLTSDYYRDKAYDELEGQCMVAQDQAGRERKRNLGLESRLMDAERNLVMAHTALSALPKEQLAALEAFKSAGMSVSASFEHELKIVHQAHSSTQAELDIANANLEAERRSRAQLNDDLVQARKILDTLASRQSQVGSAVPDAGSLVINDLDQSRQLNDQLRQRLRLRNEQLAQAEQEKHELQRRVKAGQDGRTPSSYKTALDLVHRENRLIATAFFDISTRLQSNHVVLQRRNEAPQSPMARHRLLVSATPRR